MMKYLTTITKRCYCCYRERARATVIVFAHPLCSVCELLLCASLPATVYRHSQRPPCEWLMEV